MKNTGHDVANTTKQKTPSIGQGGQTPATTPDEDSEEPIIFRDDMVLDEDL